MKLKRVESPICDFLCEFYNKKYTFIFFIIDGVNFICASIFCTLLSTSFYPAFASL